jgi:hypothetical protein
MATQDDPGTSPPRENPGEDPTNETNPIQEIGGMNIGNQDSTGPPDGGEKQRLEDGGASEQEHLYVKEVTEAAQRQRRQRERVIQQQEEEEAGLRNPAEPSDMTSMFQRMAELLGQHDAQIDGNGVDPDEGLYHHTPSKSRMSQCKSYSTVD